jgi:hypothetical protein
MSPSDDDQVLRRPCEPRRWRSRANIAGLLLVLAAAAGCGGSGDYVDGRAYWSGVAADLDGDGRIDIATSVAEGGSPPHPGHVAVFLQDAAAPTRFLTARLYDVGNDPFGMAAGDFNGDGRIDLASKNEILATSGAGLADISVLLQRSSARGEFDAAISCAGVYGSGLRAPEDPACPTLALGVSFDTKTARADLDGDGLVDTAVVNSGRLSNGCTAFDCDVVDTYVEVTLQNPAQPGSVQYGPRDGGFITFVAAADLDGDGRTDLVIGQSNGLYLRLQDPSAPGRFGPAQLISR